MKKDTEISFYKKEISKLINRVELLKDDLNKKDAQLDILRLVINSTDDLIFYKDKNFLYLGCNSAFEKFVGKSAEEIIGKNDFQLFDEKTAVQFRKTDNLMLRDNKIRSNFEWVTYPDGSNIYLHTQKMPFSYDKSEDIGIVGISRDVTKVHLAYEKLKKQSYIDELTKAYNRKSYNEKIVDSIELFRRYKEPFSLVLFDIDDFKSVNDTYGHDIGDRVLIEIVKKVNSIIRENDKMFRMGGEEFVIIFPKTKLFDAFNICEKIREEIENKKILENGCVTISLGVTEVKDKDTKETIYKRVDNLLYTSKNRGKNSTSSDFNFDQA